MTFFNDILILDHSLRVNDKVGVVKQKRVLISDPCAVVTNNIFKVKAMPPDVSGSSIPAVVPVKVGRGFLKIANGEPLRPQSVRLLLGVVWLQKNWA